MHKKYTKPRPLGRPRAFAKDVVVSVRFEQGQYDVLKDFAAIESSYSGRQVTAVELIRLAVKFVFEDNEKLRECFRRSREAVNRRWDKRYK